ncbi:MAG: DUF885 domain-containing protein [Bacteroidetes bacterium]|nr:DUF885 domain-containing protein [Bacteroidota bacterium]
MKKYLLVIASGILLFSCTNNKLSQKSDAQFEDFKNYFVEELWRINPSWASSVGFHKYDSILEIPSTEAMAAKMKAYELLDDSLKKFEENSLSGANKIDLWMMRDHVHSSQWYFNSFRSQEWNPSNYNVGGDFADMLNGNYDKLENRLHSINLKLDHVADYYKAGEAQIKNPTMEHTDLAIMQNQGSVSVFGDAMADSVKKSSLREEEKKQILQKMETAKAAINGYVTWLTDLKKTLKPETAKSFRIGKELFDKKFEYDIQSGYKAEQMYDKAVKRKGELHVEMSKLSSQLWKKYFGDRPVPADTLTMIHRMIDTLSVIHVHRDSFMSAIEKQIPELVNFINTQKLIYIDPAKPLIVRKTPDYMEGAGAGASINSPGPYDKNANTYYNVSPLTDYTPERAESYLREYNKYILQILSIHEAIPGHYTQLVYSNNSPDIIKSILGNGAMVEGWAVYGERMMLENGYGNNEPEMWLMYYKWHLRSVCNTILDYSVHALNMKEEDAVNMLTKEAFQQEAEAKNKWRRVTLSQIQLCSYFTGFSEIYDLREEIKKKEGAQFDLEKFHEKFLSYGSAPVKYIGQLMLADEK